MLELGLIQIKEKEELSREILICVKNCQNGKSKKWGLLKIFWSNPHKLVKIKYGWFVKNNDSN